MGRNYIKKLEKYYKIYREIDSNPGIPIYRIAKNTGLARSSVSRYLHEMYDNSLLKGPIIFLKPAHNYHQFASFLVFSNPVISHKCFEGFPFVISRSLACGNWNILLVSEKLMDYTMFKDFKTCILEGKKSMTYLSPVTCLDWDTSMERVYDRLSSPVKKTWLYEEILENPCFKSL